MSDQEEMDNMPIWQNHEQRITALELTMTGLSAKMDNVENTVRDGNQKAHEKLETIDNRLMEEFFQKRKTNRDNTWGLIGKIFGTGGIIYIIFDLVISRFL